MDWQRSGIADFLWPDAKNSPKPFMRRTISPMENEQERLVLGQSQPTHAQDAPTPAFSRNINEY